MTDPTTHKMQQMSFAFANEGRLPDLEIAALLKIAGALNDEMRVMQSSLDSFQKIEAAGLARQRQWSALRELASIRGARRP